MNQDTPPERPAISPPLNQKKILKARAWVATSGQRWCLGDSKRLLLNITPSKRAGATQSWIWRREVGGRARDFGLGSWPETTIERARELALDTERRFRETGVHPIDVRRQEKSRAAVVKASQLTFGQAAAEFFRQTAPSWRSVKTAVAWRSTILGLTPTGAPSEADWCRRIRPVLLSDITTPLVVAALEERWGEATGPRVARAISSVFQWALARQLRQPPDPAAWGVISKALASPTKHAKHVVPHFKAMDWRLLPAFFAELQRRTDIAAKALQLLILCASRTKEIRGAAWSEISDLEGAAPLWTIPGPRMKGGKKYRVPLSRPAVAMLKAMPREIGNPLIFTASQPGQPMAHDNMLRVLADMGHAGITAHGFRSAFSDFCHERTAADPLIIEASLAHAAGGKVERIYRRGDLMEKRAWLMEQWAQYLLSGEVEASTANVTTLQGGARDDAAGESISNIEPSAEPAQGVLLEGLNQVPEEVLLHSRMQERGKLLRRVIQVDRSIAVKNAAMALPQKLLEELLRADAKLRSGHITLSLDRWRKRVSVIEAYFALLQWREQVETSPHWLRFQYVDLPSTKNRHWYRLSQTFYGKSVDLRRQMNKVRAFLRMYNGTTFFLPRQEDAAAYSGYRSGDLIRGDAFQAPYRTSLNVSSPKKI